MKRPHSKGQNLRWRPDQVAIHGFSLIELLVVVSIITVLGSVVVSSVKTTSDKAKTVQCLGKMRNLGQGILLYTQDVGEFPRSAHSAAGAQTQTWMKTILPYLGYPAEPNPAQWAEIVTKLYRCPADEVQDVNIYSYALNVHYELNPDGDDYVGAPQTWRKPLNLDHSASTILLAETKPVYMGDHFMSHTWTSDRGATNAIAGTRHGKKSNYLFADGHAETLAIADTYQKAKNLNLWNPSLAGKQN